jgi:hypothetical protein
VRREVDGDIAANSANRSSMLTGSWQPYVKNFAPNHSFDNGNRAAALWLDR